MAPLALDASVCILLPLEQIREKKNPQFSNLFFSFFRVCTRILEPVHFNRAEPRILRVLGVHFEPAIEFLGRACVSLVPTVLVPYRSPSLPDSSDHEQRKQQLGLERPVAG